MHEAYRITSGCIEMLTGLVHIILVGCCHQCCSEVSSLGLYITSSALALRLACRKAHAKIKLKIVTPETWLTRLRRRR